MVIFFLVLVGSVIGSALGTYLCLQSLAREAKRDPEIHAPWDTRSEPNLRKPVYNTPEKAALHEAGRKLPPQWTGKANDGTLQKL